MLQQYLQLTFIPVLKCNNSLSFGLENILKTLAEVNKLDPFLDKREILKNKAKIGKHNNNNIEVNRH